MIPTYISFHNSLFFHGCFCSMTTTIFCLFIAIAPSVLLLYFFLYACLTLLMFLEIYQEMDFNFDLSTYICTT